LGGVWGCVPLALYYIISGYGWDSGVMLGSGFVDSLPPTGRGLVQFACTYVCSMIGGGGVAGLRALYHVIVCQSALVGRGEIPP